jgi:N-methylhydantoinase B
VERSADDVRADVHDRNITPEAALTRYGIGD